MGTVGAGVVVAVIIGDNLDGGNSGFERFVGHACGGFVVVGMVGCGGMVEPSCMVGL